MTWTAAACCRLFEAALLPPKSPDEQRTPSAAAYAKALQRDIILEGSTASRLASRKRQQAAAVHVMSGLAGKPMNPDSTKEWGQENGFA